MWSAILQVFVGRESTLKFDSGLSVHQVIFVPGQDVSLYPLSDKRDEDSCRVRQLKGLFKVQEGHKGWLVVDAVEDIGNAFSSAYPFLVSIQMWVKRPYSVFESFQDHFFSAVLPKHDVRAIGLGFGGSLGFRMGWVS